MGRYGCPGAENSLLRLRKFAVVCWIASLAIPGLASFALAQNGSAPQSQQQDIPDAPSAVKPPQSFPTNLPPSRPEPSSDQPAPAQPAEQPTGDSSTPPPMPPVKTVPPGSVPSDTNTRDDLYTIKVLTNFVLVPVTVKDPSGHNIDGLLSKDFSVFEDGKKQQLKFFTSDPFPLSAAIVLDLGMSDAAVQKVNQTFTALEGAFSPYDEVALYTFSTTVSQVSDFSSVGQRLTAV